MPDLRLTVNGSPRVVPADTTVGEIFSDAGVSAIAARGPDGALHDLTWLPADGDVVESIPMTSPEGLAIVRHSTAHVLAQAVQKLFPDARLGIGPPIDNGFYYDFDVASPFTPEDLERLEAVMAQIIAEGQRFARRVVTDGEARAELAAEPYKLELIGLKGPGAGAAQIAAT